MNKIAFVIPVYPPHYHHLKFLEKLPSSYDFDIYFILTYKDDATTLKDLYTNNSYSVIILENYFTKDFINKILANRAIITFKKYFGMSLLMDTYDYISAVDCEIEFANIENIYEKFNKVCQEKLIVGSHIDGINRFQTEMINKNCLLFLNNNDIQKLIPLINNYFWFSDIPIYDSRIFKEYLYYIDFFNYENIVGRMNWFIFDYIPYIYYAALYHNYKILNVKDYGINRNWSLESMPYTTYKKVFETMRWAPLWSIYKEYNKDDDMYKNIILLYHKDRSSIADDFLNI